MKFSSEMSNCKNGFECEMCKEPDITAAPSKGNPTPSPEAAREADVNVAPSMLISEALM